MNRFSAYVYCLTALLSSVGIAESVAQDAAEALPSVVLTEDQWRRIDESSNRGLAWLAKQQQRDGSFPTLPNGQPGVTSLCVLAFMAHGHLPGDGPYGRQLELAVDFVVSCQKRNGMLAQVLPDRETIPRNVSHQVGSAAVYNHAFAGLLLSEAYAMHSLKKAERIRPVIEQALDATLEMQNFPKDRPVDEGGWRYLDDNDRQDSDLSVTGWELMFLRSAKNAGFDVPQEPIDRAIGFVRRCFREDYATFTYKLVRENRTSRGMSGAGILALAHAGQHNTREAQLAGDWLLKYGFERYNEGSPASRRSRNDDPYHYGLFTCCQAMYQLGGHHWQQFFPPTAEVILANQRSSGSWSPENVRRDARFGSAYTTALCLLALGAPNQLLPIFQR